MYMNRGGTALAVNFDRKGVHLKVGSCPDKVVGGAVGGAVEAAGIVISFQRHALLPRAPCLYTLYKNSGTNTVHTASVMHRRPPCAVAEQTAVWSSHATE
jgi:hypothetical protein